MFAWFGRWEALNYPIGSKHDDSPLISVYLAGKVGRTRSTRRWTRLCLLIGVYLVGKVGSPELAVQDLQYGGQDAAGAVGGRGALR